MMEEKQLARLKPFTWIGAFSVVRERPREAFQSFRYAVNLLKAKPGRTVWIFPQGEILPNDSRPLRFFRGFAKIAEESAPCAVLPMAIRYEFLGSYKPDILVSIGAPTVINVSERLSDAFAFEVESLLAGIAEDLLTDGCSTYTKLLRG
jgi:1-acyl-sn-glycerol-3-phosphate acyltransferase